MMIFNLAIMVKTDGAVAVGSSDLLENMRAESERRSALINSLPV
jgi:hypothetical protein